MKLPAFRLRIPSASDITARIFAVVVISVAGVMIVSKAEVPDWLETLVQSYGLPSVSSEAGLTNYVRFHEVDLDDGGSVHTGLRFQDLAHMDRPERGWCYLSQPQENLNSSYRLTLAEQSGGAAPVFADIDEEAVRLFGRTAEDVERLARLHCNFEVPNN